MTCSKEIRLVNFSATCDVSVLQIENEMNGELVYTIFVSRNRRVGHADLIKTIGKYPDLMSKVHPDQADIYKAMKYIEEIQKLPLEKINHPLAGSSIELESKENVREVLHYLRTQGFHIPISAFSG